MISKVESLDDLISQSHQRPVFIFKHSSTCPTSSMALKAVESFLAGHEDMKVYKLSVQTDRQLSNEVAQRFMVKHESPQLLLIHAGQAEATLNHFQISAAAIESLWSAYFR